MSSNNYDYLPKNNLQYFLNKLKAKFLGKDALDDTSTSASTLWSSNKVSAELDKKAKKEFTGTTAEWNALTTSQKAEYEIVNLTDDYDVQVKIDDTTPASNKVYSSQKTQTELNKKLSYADNGILGATNLAPNNAVSQTVNGVTLTVNYDGSVTASDNTASANIRFVLGTIILKAGVTYRINDNQNGTYSSENYHGCMIRRKSDGYWLMCTANIDIPPVYTPNSDIEVEIGIFINSGYNANRTIYPMLCLNSYNGSYVPYAKTNRELTDDIAYKELTITNTSSKITFSDTIKLVRTGKAIYFEFGNSSIKFEENLANNTYETIATITDPDFIPDLRQWADIRFVGHYELCAGLYLNSAGTLGFQAMSAIGAQTLWPHAIGVVGLKK